MNFPSEGNRRRMNSDRIRSDFKALSEQSKRKLPTIDQTAQNVWKHNLRRSEEGSLMKMLYSLRSHPAMATMLGIAIVAAVLLAVPISYTKTTGYLASLEISETAGIDIKALANEFGKVLDTEDVKVVNASGRVRVSAEVPVSPRGNLEAITTGFAEALAKRGIPAEAAVEALTERVTGNVYAMAANGIIEIRINSEGMTDEEIEAEIRQKIEAAGLEAALVDVETGDGEKRIEIGIRQNVEGGSGSSSTPVKIVLDGMEPPPGGECVTERAFELRISAEGKTPEEVEAEALEHLQAMGLTDIDEIDIERCGDYYVIRASASDAGSINGGAGAALGNPQSESKTLSELKQEFSD